MKMGIVGLPNVGKSTLFNALTNAGAEAANYPFCTIDPNVGVVAVPDGRLDFLAKLYNPKKVTPAIVEFVDIAGLVRGASRGEGLGNKFLSHIRAVDAIVHVVRCFDSGNITHVEGGTNPLRDIEIVDTELILADIEYLNRQTEKLKKVLKGDKTVQYQVNMLERLQAHSTRAKTQGRLSLMTPLKKSSSRLLSCCPRNPCSMPQTSTRRLQGLCSQLPLPGST